MANTLPQGPPYTGLEGELLQTRFQDAGDDGYHHSLSNLQIQMGAAPWQGQPGCDAG